MNSEDNADGEENSSQSLESTFALLSLTTQGYDGLEEADVTDSSDNLTEIYRNNTFSKFKDFTLTSQADYFMK